MGDIIIIIQNSNLQHLSQTSATNSVYTLGNFMADGLQVHDWKQNQDYD